MIKETETLEAVGTVKKCRLILPKWFLNIFSLIGALFGGVSNGVITSIYKVWVSIPDTTISTSSILLVGLCDCKRNKGDTLVVTYNPIKPKKCKIVKREIS
jgi:hypothetical protein